MRKHRWALRQDVSQKAPMSDMPASPPSVTSTEQGECACVINKGGGGHAAAPDWPIAVKKTPPSLTIGLVTHAKDDLRGAVVARDYIRCHEEAGGGGPGQTEVQDL